MASYNKYNAACPDETDLIRYKNGSLPGQDKDFLSEHLLICHRCPVSLDMLNAEEFDAKQADDDRDTLDESITERLRGAVDKYHERVAADPGITPTPLNEFLGTGQQLEVGQIWRTKLDGIVVPTQSERTYSVTELGSVPHLVVITKPFQENLYVGDDRYPVVKVVPISDNVELAAEGDIVVDKEVSPLGYPLMLETWNQQHMLRNNLDAYLAHITVSPESSTIENKNILDMLTERGEQTEYDEANDFSFFGLIRKGIYADPRMRFRAMEFENTVYLREPYLLLREVADEAVATIPFKETMAELPTEQPVLSVIFDLIYPKRAPAFASSALTSRTDDGEWVIRIESDLLISVYRKGHAEADRSIVLSFVDGEAVHLELEPVKLKPHDENWLRATFELTVEDREKVGEGCRPKIDFL